MHFGIHLVRNNIIDSDDFVDAVEQQIQSRPQLGGLAIETGKLTVKQVFQILRAQCDAPEELFGELAISFGFITEEELTSLIFLQSVRQKPIAEIIVGNGCTTEEEVLTHLSNFRHRTQESHEDSLATVH